MRIERLRQEWHIDVRFVHFPLHPETPPEGQTLEQLFRGRGIDIPSSQARLKRLCEEEGLQWGHRTMTFNSRLAQELACFAQTTPQADSIHDALFKAYFVDGVNLADINNLVSIASSIGLDEEDTGGTLVSRRFRDEVDVDWERSRALGITGVPAFVINGRGVAGAQPYEFLEQLLEQSGATRRS